MMLNLSLVEAMGDVISTEHRAWHNSEGHRPHDGAGVGGGRAAGQTTAHIGVRVVARPHRRGRSAPPARPLRARPADTLGTSISETTMRPSPIARGPTIPPRLAPMPPAARSRVYAHQHVNLITRTSHYGSFTVSGVGYSAGEPPTYAYR